MNMVVALLKYGAIPGVKQASRTQTLLHVAAEYGQPDLTKLILQDGGIDINQCDISGKTPLHYVAKYGRTEIVNVMLADNKIDINPLDVHGLTPLHVAVNRHHAPVVKLLLQDKRIDINKAGNNALTPLEHAIKCCVRNPDTSCWLDKKRMTNNMEIINLLIQHDQMTTVATSTLTKLLNLAQEEKCQYVVDIIAQKLFINSLIIEDFEGVALGIDKFSNKAQLLKSVQISNIKWHRK